MNPEDRLALADLRRDQSRLHDLVGQLDRRIDLLVLRVERPAPVLPPPLPKVTPPPAAEPSLPRASQTSPETAPIPTPAEKGNDERAGARASEPTATPPPIPASPSPAPAEPLELRLGTYWMSRLGIVILLTGLVFLGNYAYHQIVPKLGAWGKLALLTLAGAGLGWLGAWLERSRESMRNYGRVLLAGGAATLYYTAYAAHFVEGLRVIASPLLGGGLLLALAALFVCFADRRRSEAVAVPAVLLAYYTSAINAISGFTLFSNLLLAGAAVFFLWRHRWTRLTWLSLGATYGSYVFWRVNHLLHVGGGFAEFGPAIQFLTIYWAVFTVAAFVAAPTALQAPARVAFVTLNNAAYLTLAAGHFSMQRPGSFWIFAVTFGGGLLLLAVIARRLRTEERALDGSYLAQGLALATIGLAARLTGPQLSVVLAAESAALLVAARARHQRLLEIGAWLCALGATGLTVTVLARQGAAPLAVGLPVLALLIFDAWWAKRLAGPAVAWSARALVFSTLALGTLAAVLWRAVPATGQPTAFALAAVAALAARRARLPELAWPGQTFLAGGLLIFVARTTDAMPQPWWFGVPLIAMAIGLMHWWQGAAAASLDAALRPLAPLACAAVAVTAGAAWMRAGFATPEQWLVGTSSAALGCLLYARVPRGWPLAVVGQAFTGLAVASFAMSFFGPTPDRWAALAPVLAVGVTAALGGRWAGERTALGMRLAVVAGLYRYAASALLAAWALVHVTPAWRVLFYAGSGAAMIVAGALGANRERRGIGALYAAAALALFWVRVTPQPVAWPELLAIVAVPASLRLGQRLCGPEPVLPLGRDALVGAALASLWLWVTRWVHAHDDASQLTIAWALLAVVIFAAGLGLRERLYRVGGFGVLALAIGRLFVVDVWRFDTLPRIAAFLVLGVVLLALSFVYHRFAETLRRWL